MAKGQKRGNREIRKPKAIKTAAVKVETTSSLFGRGAMNQSVPPKKAK